MKRLILAAFLILMLWSLTAVAVSREEIINTASTWHRLALPAANQLNCVSSANAVYNSEDSSAIDWYIVNFAQGGYILISAEDKAVPILSYDLENTWSDLNLPENQIWFLNTYHQQFSLLRNGADIQTHPDWTTLRRGDYSAFLPTRPVSPLLSTNWDQDWPYNSMCPTAPGGPGGRCYVGCMALSMGQVMKYWAYPPHGTGSHTYTHPTYGSQTANFGATTYNWSAMPNILYGTANTNISTLLYQCAVAVDMDFAPDGSGAQAGPARLALMNYFSYENSVLLGWKSSYTDAAWHTLLHEDLDAHRPVLYVGYDTDAGGHAWVCDGYQGTNYYHMNWGWNGSNNGYFYVTNLNPSGYQFNSNQGGIFRIQPPAPVQPPTNLTAGVTDDNNVLLQWTAPATRTLSSFTVFRNGASIATLDDVVNTSYFDVNLSAGTYQYHIIANFSQGDSSPSNTATAVIYPAAVVNYEDTFEAYADFSAAITPWFSYDSDLSTTQTLEDVNFPNEGNPMGFVVFNPTATTPPLTAFSAYDGTKMLACMGAIGSANNDWLVSPKWNTGSQAHLRFWAKTAYPANGLEQFKIGVSLTSPNPSAMTIVSGAEPMIVPGVWTEYNFTLTAQAFSNVFVGIECVTPAGYMLLIDKVQLWSSYVGNADTTLPVTGDLSLRAYPNPFNPSTTLFWHQKSASTISIRIYDIKGRLVGNPVNESKAAGSHNLTWGGTDQNGNSLPTGIYHIRLTDAQGNAQTQKIMLIK